MGIEDDLLTREDIPDLHLAVALSPKIFEESPQRLFEGQGGETQ